jgi:NAD(P)H-hydrate epimerase
MRLVGSAEMRAIDRAAIEEMGIPSLALMERAGAAVAEAAAPLAGPGGRFRVLCGGGNNGGDGYVAARLLAGSGRTVDVLALVPTDRLSPDAAAMRERAAAAGVAIRDAAGRVEPLAAAPGDVVVDALLGTGLARPAEGIFAEAIASIAAARTAAGAAKPFSSRISPMRFCEASASRS